MIKENFSKPNKNHTTVNKTRTNRMDWKPNKAFISGPLVLG